MGQAVLTTDELIKALREEAGRCDYPEETELMLEAADRLEEQNERIDIMMADMDRGWGKSY